MAVHYWSVVYLSSYTFPFFFFDIISIYHSILQHLSAFFSISPAILAFSVILAFSSTLQHFSTVHRILIIYIRLFSFTLVTLQYLFRHFFFGPLICYVFFFCDLQVWPLEDTHFEKIPIKYIEHRGRGVVINKVIYVLFQIMICEAAKNSKSAKEA